jgi:hypothetical protein
MFHSNPSCSACRLMLLIRWAVPHQLAIHCSGEDVGLEVKAGTLSHVDPDFGALVLE